jgi:hypothetical protein
MERCSRDVRGVGLVCFEEKNEAAIYRRMERKKKTMKEIKKEREEKWNLSGR